MNEKTLRTGLGFSGRATFVQKLELSFNNERHFASFFHCHRLGAGMKKERLEIILNLLSTNLIIRFGDVKVSFSSLFSRRGCRRRWINWAPFIIGRRVRITEEMFAQQGRDSWSSKRIWNWMKWRKSMVQGFFAWNCSLGDTAIWDLGYKKLLRSSIGYCKCYDS